MLVDDGGFAEWVSANFGIGADDILRKCLKEFVTGHLRTTVHDRLDEELLISRQCFLPRMFLENDKVGAGIGSGILAESVVRQTQSRHEVGSLHKLHSHERRGGIHHTLRRNKGYKSTFTHLVETFEKEIVM